MVYNITLGEILGLIDLIMQINTLPILKNSTKVDLFAALRCFPFERQQLVVL